MGCACSKAEEDTSGLELRIQAALREIIKAKDQAKEAGADDVQASFTRIILKFPVLRRAIASIRQVFYKFDADQSGLIDKGELHLCLHALGAEMSEEDAWEMFKYANFSHKGALTFKEFVLCLCLASVLQLLPQLQAYDTGAVAGSGGGPGGPGGPVRSNVIAVAPAGSGGGHGAGYGHGPPHAHSPDSSRSPVGGNSNNGPLPDIDPEDSAQLMAHGLRLVKALRIILEAYVLFDRDGSGTIDRDEVLAMIDEENKKENGETLDTPTGPPDSGAAAGLRSGTLRTLSPGGTNAPAPPPKKKMKESGGNVLLSKERWMELDYDDSGEISFAEFVHAFMDWVGIEDEEDSDREEADRGDSRGDEASSARNSASSSPLPHGSSFHNAHSATNSGAGGGGGTEGIMSRGLSLLRMQSFSTQKEGQGSAASTPSTHPPGGGAASAPMPAHGVLKHTLSGTPVTMAAGGASPAHGDPAVAHSQAQPLPSARRGLSVGFDPAALSTASAASPAFGHAGPVTGAPAAHSHTSVATSGGERSRDSQGGGQGHHSQSQSHQLPTDRMSDAEVDDALKLPSRRMSVSHLKDANSGAILHTAEANEQRIINTSRSLSLHSPSSGGIAGPASVGAPGAAVSSRGRVGSASRGPEFVITQSMSISEGTGAGGVAPGAATGGVVGGGGIRRPSLKNSVPALGIAASPAGTPATGAASASVRASAGEGSLAAASAGNTSSTASLGLPPRSSRRAEPAQAAPPSASAADGVPSSVSPSPLLHRQQTFLPGEVNVSPASTARQSQTHAPGAGGEHAAAASASASGGGSASGRQAFPLK